MATFPKPPEYYTLFRDGSTQMKPPAVITRDYYSFGTLMPIYNPVVDYVYEPIPYMFNKEEFDKCGDQKYNDIKRLLKMLVKGFYELLKAIDNGDQASNGKKLLSMYNTVMNIYRILNRMREYQLREEIIRNLKNQISENGNRILENQQQLDSTRQALKQICSELKALQSENQSYTESQLSTKEEEKIVAELINDVESVAEGDYVRLEIERKASEDIYDQPNLEKSQEASVVKAEEILDRSQPSVTMEMEETETPSVLFEGGAFSESTFSM